MSFAEIERIIDRYDAATTGLDQAVTDRISRSLDAAYRNLDRELRLQYPIWESDGSLYAAQRRLLLMEQLGPLVEIVNPAQRTEYEALFTDTLQTAHISGAALADELIRVRNPGYPLQDFTTIPIEAAVAQARDGVNRLYRYNDDFKATASSVVEQGLIQGWGTGRVASLLQREVGVTKSKAETIARTEVMSAFNTAATQRYTENGIEFQQLMVTPSEALCPACAARHGNVYKVGEVSLPLHPRCRCAWLPFQSRWQELGLTDDAAVEESRDRIVAEFQAGGGRLDTGPTYWERKAGLSAAPTPVWKPGDAPLPSQPRPTPARPVEPPPPPVPSQPPPPPPPVPEPSAVAALPENHVVTNNPRISVDSLNSGLDSIQTNGASERVQMFRSFVEKNQIQVLLHDPMQSNSDWIKTVRSNLSDQSFVSALGDLREHVISDDSAAGYTNAYYNHIVVTSTSRNRAGRFTVDGARLENQSANILVSASMDSTIGSTTYRLAHRDSREFVTYLHEMGHQVYFKAGIPAIPDDIAGSTTDYGATNEHEWFAEHFALWMLDEDGYRALDPVGSAFIRKTLSRATSNPVTIAELEER